MADNNDKKLNERSFLAAAVTAAPAVAGVGYAVRQALNHPATAPSTSGIDKAMAAIYRAQKRAGHITTQDHAAIMRAHQKKGVFSARNAQIAWEEAMKTADPFAKKHLPSMAKSISGLPEIEVVEALEQVLHETKSQYAEPVIRSFNRNLSALVKTPESVNLVTLQGLHEAQWAPKPLPNNIKKYLDPFLGGETPMTKFYSRPEHPGFGTYMINYFGPAGQDVSLRVPVSQGNIVMTGLTQKTTRISPTVGVLKNGELQKMSRGQYFMQEFAETIGKDIHEGRLTDQRQINTAINTLYDEVYGKLETVPTVGDHQSTALWNYKYTRSHGIELKVPSKSVQQYGENYRYQMAYEAASEAEMAAATKQFGLNAGVSPAGYARGMMQGQHMNLAELQPIPEAVDLSRRPESGLRTWGLSPSSYEDMQSSRFQRYMDYEGELGKTLRIDTSNAALRVTYVEPEVLRRLNVNEGEAAGSRYAFRNQVYENVKPIHLTRAHQALLEEDYGALKVGEVLGWNTEGEAVRYQKNMRILGSTMHDTHQGNILTLQVMDRRRIISNSKFHGDFKALVRLTEEKWLESRVRKITNDEILAKNTDVLVSVKELKKDPGKYSKQIISALGEELTLKGRTYNMDEIISSLRSASVDKSGAFNKEVFTREAMNIAFEHDLPPSSFGRVFGTAKHVIGREATTEIIQAAAKENAYGGQFLEYAKAASESRGRGIARVAYGGPEELRGAGKIGTVEPRIFNILEGPASLGVGPALGEDIMQRMGTYSPEKLATHKELGKTLGSVIGEVRPGKDAAIMDIGKRGFSEKEFTQRVQAGKPFWMNPGKGLNSIYVPGAETVAGMKPFNTGSDIIQGPLAKVYQDIGYQAGRMYSDISPLTPEAFNKHLSAFTRDIHKQWAPGGKGAGAYMRGSVPGSVGLTGVSRVGRYSGAIEYGRQGRTKNLYTVGIPEKYAKEMVTGMKQTGLYSKEEMQVMQKWLKGKQKTIGGVLWRHPFIDEHSIQQMQFEIIKGSNAKQMVIPELNTSIKVAGKQVDLTLGALSGLAGDKDADIFYASLVDPKLEKGIRSNITNTSSEYVQRHVQNQIRYQIMSEMAGPGKEILSKSNNIIAAARKLATTERYIPRLSLQFSEAKRALRAGGGSADAHMFLTWLEQTPISSKHLPGSRAAAGELETLMQQLLGAFESRNPQAADALADTARSIMKNSPVAQEMFNKDIELSRRDARRIGKAFNMKMPRQLKKTDLNAVSREIMTLMNKYGQGNARMDELVLNRGAGIRRAEISSMLKHAVQASTTAAHGMMSRISSSAVTAINRMGALGRGIIKHHKAIGFGFAGSLAIGAILSKPQSLVGSGQGMIPSGRLSSPRDKAANRMSPESVHPGGRSIGRPQAPAMSPPAAAIAPPADSISMRMQTGAGVNPAAVAGRVSRFTGGGSSVNLNVRDNRASLDPNSFANGLL